MKRVFSIEWPDELGELWMNTSNLLLCLTEYCRDTEFTAQDVTGDGVSDHRPQTSMKTGDHA